MVDASTTELPIAKGNIDFVTETETSIKGAPEDTTETLYITSLFLYINTI